MQSPWRCLSATEVELRLDPSDISCTLSCIRESKASVDQACQTETDDHKLQIQVSEVYKKTFKVLASLATKLRSRLEKGF